jgi:hypothetical protein
MRASVKAKKFANGGITSDLSNRIAAARARRTGVGAGVPARATPQNIRPVFSTPNFEAAVNSGATADNIAGGIGRSGGRLGNAVMGTPTAPGTTSTPRTAGPMPAPAPQPPPDAPLFIGNYDAGPQGNKKGGLIKSKNKRKSK